MDTNPTPPAPGTVDLEALYREIAAMYRDVANENSRDLHFPTGRRLAEALGYPADLLDGLPAGAVTSFAGVGYHLGLARLVPGERVLDLGSGSGMDALAAEVQVGPTGSVTGIDITPEQLAKARRLGRGRRVTFLRARIEELPFGDRQFDAVISNGVINLSPDKLAYVGDIAAAGLDLEALVENPAYDFTSERAQRTSAKYGARSISLLARKPASPTHTNAQTQEVSQ
jgi:arsenite methyltransferase